MIDGGGTPRLDASEYPEHPMHERIRDKLLAAWGRAVSANPVLTLIVCLVLAVISVTLTATRLEFLADRSQLIDPDMEWNKQYAQYKEDFPRYTM